MDAMLRIMFLNSQSAKEPLSGKSKKRA